MGFDGPGLWGFGWFGHAVGVIVYGLFSFLVLLIIATLIFLLVRFLLVATKAAQLYVAKNSPPRPVAPVATTTAPAAAPTTTTAPATKPATAAKPATAPKPPTAAKPATKPRTPKTPPV